MAGKKAAGAYLTEFERIGGGIFFICYLIVFPLTADWILRGAEKLFHLRLTQAEANAVYYYFVFAVTILVFYNFIGKNLHRFFGNLGLTFSTVAMGLVGFYGLNELIYRLSSSLFHNHTNLNDVSINAQFHTAPRTTVLIVVVLAPFVEEVLFRGYVFGMLRQRGRLLAYAVSAALFAFLQVWQFALGSRDVWYLVLMIQYLAPGVVLAWCYDRSGNLAAPVLTHMAVNALSLWLLT